LSSIACSMIITNRLSIDFWQKSGTCLDFNPKKWDRLEFFTILGRDIWVQSRTRDICLKSAQMDSLIITSNAMRWKKVSFLFIFLNHCQRLLHGKWTWRRSSLNMRFIRPKRLNNYNSKIFLNIYIFFIIIGIK